MKRPPHSFVVEVRRQRRPAGEPTPSWIEGALKSGAGAEKVEPARAPEPPRAAPATAAKAPAKPTGRILPSLVEAPPAAPSVAEAPAAAKPRAPRRRPRAPTPKPIVFVELAPVVVAPQPAAEPPAEAARPRDPARHRRILARYVFGGPDKPGERWKRRLRGDER